MSRSSAGTSRYSDRDIENALLDSDSDSDSDIEELIEGEDAGWTDDHDPEDDKAEVDDNDIVTNDDDVAPMRKRRRLLKDRLVHDLHLGGTLDSRI